VYRQHVDGVCHALSPRPSWYVILLFEMFFFFIICVSPLDYWPFVECLESASAIQSAGEQCASKAGFSDWSDINTCSTGKLGNTLQHAAAVATDGLSPKHQWTPWVVMNGSPLSQSQLSQQLVKLVCTAYKGTDKPAACNSNSVDVCSADW